MALFRAVTLSGVAIVVLEASCGGTVAGRSGASDAGSSSGSSGTTSLSSSGASSGSGGSSGSSGATSSSSGGSSGPTSSSSGSSSGGPSGSGDGSSGGPLDATVDAPNASVGDASDIFDSPISDSTSSASEAFEIIANGAIQSPISCPSSHWEFSVSSGGAVALRNIGSVPLPYIAEPYGWGAGVQYTPGVPTSGQGEEVGVLASGAVVNLTHAGGTIALIGASKPFSIYDAGFAAADEWTVSWPLGVAGSDGSSTMYVAEIEAEAECGPVYRP